jgi:hypothetical protein
MFQPHAIERSLALAHILERAGAEDFIVDNDEGRIVTEVAQEVLSGAGWL